MDSQLAHRLVACNNAFYRARAASFSATRSTPWQGWRRVVDAARDALGGDAHPRIADIACGNLRFERYLSEQLPGVSPEFLAVDSTPELAADAARNRTRFLQRDLLADLLDGRDPLSDLPSCDLTVCFGFMHHVPGDSLRRALLDTLARSTKPNGLIAISFWQFMSDARLAAKARVADEAARAAGWPVRSFEPGDHFLGWQDDPGALRYCHHFTEAEIDSLVAHLRAHGLRELDRFSADGHSGALNRYLVCRKDPA